MFKKIFNAFKGRKSRFKNDMKKEKKRFYMIDKTNTFIKKRKNKNRFKISFEVSLYIYVFGFLLALIGIIYIFKGSYFSIKKINIIINDNIIDEKIAYNSIDYIRNKSIFLETKDSIIKKLLDYQKNIKDISINKILPDTLEIHLKSFPVIMDILYNNRKYSLTSNGIVLPLKKNNENEEYKERVLIDIIGNEEDRYKTISYKKVFDKIFLENILGLIKGFENNITDLKIKKVILYIEERELHIITENKTIFIFCLEQNVEDQLKKLLVYKKEYESNLRQVYIDLRIKNKIFLCPYTSEYQCKRNLKRLYN